MGILDQLPAGAQFIDSVGIVEGGGSDRDRVATTVGLGHPGVHVHQPTSPLAPGNTSVASDAVSRRFNQFFPNSIGAWYNGDILNGDPANAPIRYPEDSVTFLSVVTPDGAVLTPGSPNILRTVHFRLLDQAKEVAEADGSVTLRIEREGDIANESLTVTYSTFDFGSATQNVDYTGVTDTVTFLPGQSFKDVTITINAADDLSEGFERFRVRLSNASVGYLITNGSPTGSGNPNGEATVTIKDANVSLATFQDEVNGYEGTSDAYIDGDGIFASQKLGQDPVVRVDQAKGDDPRPQQGLIRFDDIFGSTLGQVPVGSRIFDAFLTLNVTNGASGANIELFRMLQDWDQVNTTWENPQGNAGVAIVDGVTPDGRESTSKADAKVLEPGKAGRVQIQLNKDTFQSWANGSLPNFGWSIVSDDPSLWSFNSSEAFQAGTFKPELTILYTAPVVVDQGTFGFSVADYTVNENGGNAVITVNRIGGSTGSATVNWGVSAGTGSLADLSGSASGSVTFAAGELFKTFNVAINNDILLERNETLNLSLSGTGLTFERNAATLTIRDNDFAPSSGNLILNEIYINSPGNDPPHEFIEFSGLANMALGSLYYVAIEGLVGPDSGTFEKVINLGAFANGSNGLTLLTPQEPGYAYNVNPATTHIQGLGTIAVENVASNNDSTTFMLLYSPTIDLSTFAFDYDWNNDGSLELPVGVVIVDSLGILTGPSDQAFGPTTNNLSISSAEVDSISRKRSDSDRSDGTAWFGGNLVPAGDDYLLYEVAGSVALPVPGASMTPGDLNTGTAAQSPLVSLLSITPNAPVGTITVTFNGPISQVLSGNGDSVGPIGSAFSITDQSGVVLPTVDPRPTVVGIGSNSLTLSFTGSGVSGGQLPAGNYRLSVVGNGFVANGRVVDAANTGAVAGSDTTFNFTVSTASLIGDYNNNGEVDAADYSVYRDNLATAFALPNRAPANTGNVSQADYDTWAANFGQTASSSIAAAVAGAVPTSALAIDAALADEAGSGGPAVVTVASIDEALISLSPPRRRGFAANRAAANPLVDSAVSDRFELLLSARQTAATSDTESTSNKCDPAKPTPAETPATGLRQVLRLALRRVS